MSYGVSIDQDGTILQTAGEYLDQDIAIGMSDSIKLPAQTFNPSMTDQVIPAGKYLSGAQTIKACAGTKQITENGTYDVTGYAMASVNVPSNYQEGTVILPSNSAPFSIPVQGTVSHMFVFLDSQYTSWTSSTFCIFFATADWVIAHRFSHSSQTFNNYSYPSAIGQYVNCQFNNGSVVFSQNNIGLSWGYGQFAKWIAW